MKYIRILWIFSFESIVCIVKKNTHHVMDIYLTGFQHVRFSNAKKNENKNQHMIAEAYAALIMGDAVWFFLRL